MKVKLQIENIEEQEYFQREAYNSLRTNLQFCGDDLKVVMLTSCTPNEGKSTVAFELSRNLADAGKRVLLVDADLRKSVLIGRYRITSGEEILGLSHFLSGQKKLEDVIYGTDIEKFDMIVAGPVPPNPSELLGKKYFDRLLEYGRENYDLVILDCPPLGAVIDAAVIAPKCDGAILVIESGQNSFHFLQDVKKQLEMTGVRILGAVLNKVKVQKSGYYKKYYRGYYSKYSKYGYGYYGNDEDKNA